MTLLQHELTDFKVNAFQNNEFHEVTKDDVLGHWSLFFFYPADFTFVCPTELEDLAKNYAKFKEIGCEIYSVSCDTHFVHKAWHDANEKIAKIAADKDEAIKGQDFEKAAELRDKQEKLEADRKQKEDSWREGESDVKMVVDEDVIAEVISSTTGIPVFKLTQAESKKLLNMEAELHKRIIGQDEAVSALSRSIRRTRVGLKDPKRPSGSFIFAGPTGVGKTELAKTLAEFLFDDEDALIRVDMSEFSEKYAASRLFGAPPGYVGYEEGGELTEKVRRKPFSVVLFDEIEKAHPDVLNVLLQILDDGEITDSHGRRVNFENTIIVMTSNAGSGNQDGGTVGFDRSQTQQDADKAMKALQQFLRPEFINRVDAVITFNRLSKENFKEIAKIMLGELVTSLGDKGITFTYDDSLVEFLVEKSFSRTYGARNLRRTIQKELEDPMATEIIDSYEHPVSRIHATAENGAIRLDAL